MQECPLRTTVIGSYPFPSWLEHACLHLGNFGAADIREMQEDAVAAAVRVDAVTGQRWVASESNERRAARDLVQVDRGVSTRWRVPRGSAGGVMHQGW